MENIITKHYKDLCSFTDINIELLIVLKHENIIPDSLYDKINEEASHLKKSALLYDNIKLKPETDLSRFIDALKVSCNAKAVNILEVETVSTSSEGNCSTQVTRRKKNAVPSAMASVLKDDDLLLRQWIKVQDVLGLASSDFHALERGMKTDTMDFEHLLNRAISTWVGRNGSSATIQQMLNNLIKHKFVNAAYLLERNFNPTDKVEFLNES